MEQLTLTVNTNNCSPIVQRMLTRDPKAIQNIILTTTGEVRAVMGRSPSMGMKVGVIDYDHSWIALTLYEVTQYTVEGDGPSFKMEVVVTIYDEQDGISILEDKEHGEVLSITTGERPHGQA